MKDNNTDKEILKLLRQAEIFDVMAKIGSRQEWTVGSLIDAGLARSWGMAAGSTRRAVKELMQDLETSGSLRRVKDPVREWAWQQIEDAPHLCDRAS